MKIKDVMSANPVYCTPDIRVQEAAQMMRAHDCGALPIVESGKSRKPVGVVTDRDMVVRLIAEGGDVHRTMVSQVMTPVAVSVTPETDLDEAARRMRDEQLRRLIVVDRSGACIGLVSLADVVNVAGTEPAAAVLRDVSRPAPSPDARRLELLERNEHR